MINRYKIRYKGTALTGVHIKGKLSDNPSPEEVAEFEQGLKDAVKAATPQAQIANWRNMAEELGVGGDLLDEAEKWIGTDHQRFELFLLRATTEIVGAANERDLIPPARDGLKAAEERRRGGLDSHGLTEEKRRERDKIIQNEVVRLCLERERMGYKEACKRAGKDVIKICAAAGLEHENIKPLSGDHVRKITVNPGHSLTK
ncbi:MAG: hypothetical protein R6W72_07710 [Desulfurivibrionaceae bacterium]